MRTVLLDCDDIALCLGKTVLRICGLAKEGGAKPDDSFVDAELCVTGGDGQVEIVSTFEETAMSS